MSGPRKKLCLRFESIAGRNDALSYLQGSNPPFEVHTPSKTDVIINDTAYKPLSTFLTDTCKLREGHDFHVHPVKNVSELLPSQAKTVRSAYGRAYPYDQDVETLRKIAHDLALNLKAI